MLSNEGQDVKGEADNSVSDFPEFNPSDKQLALLSTYQDTSYAVTVKDACGITGIDRKTYYNWMQVPGFKRWWIGCIEDHFIGSLVSVYAQLVKIVEDGVKVASAGQVGAAKLLLERFDKLYRPKTIQEHTGSGTIEEYLERAARRQLEEEARLSGQNPVDRPGPPEPSVEPGKAPSAPATSP